MPLAERLRPVDPVVPGTDTTVSLKEGIWLISKPAFGLNADGEHCVGTGTLWMGRMCSPQYGELLLVTPDRSRILRAVPFPAFAPAWLLRQDDAMYCGRGGDGAEWQSMVCRVDRDSGQWRAKVFPNDGQPADHWIAPEFIRAGNSRWRVDLTQVYNLQQPGWSGMGLGVRDTQAGTTILDPDTLEGTPSFRTGPGRRGRNPARQKTSNESSAVVRAWFAEPACGSAVREVFRGG